MNSDPLISQWLQMLRACGTKADSLVDQHLNENKSLLLTILLYEILLLVIDEYDKSDLTHNCHNLLGSIGDVIQQGYYKGPDYLRNAIVVSFLEVYGRVGSRHPHLTHLLGRDMEAIINNYDAEYGCAFGDLD